MRQKTGNSPLQGAAVGRGTTFVCLQDVTLGPQASRPLSSLPSSPASPQANFEKKQESPQPVPFWWFAVYCQDSHSSPPLCHAHTAQLYFPRLLPKPPRKTCAGSTLLYVSHMSTCKNSKSARDCSKKCNQLCRTPPRKPVEDCVHEQKLLAHPNQTPF